jgi:periplasmic divalent cation tolerance protein
MNDFIFIYIPNPTKEEAKKIAKHLVQKRLVGCANIFGPVNSIYRWEGKIVDEKEFVLIAKTSEANFEKVKREVGKMHSYAIPCIVKIPVSSNKRYFDWLKGEIG